MRVQYELFRPRACVLLIALMLPVNIATASDVENNDAGGVRVVESSVADSQLTARLELLKDHDGVVYAVLLRVENRSDVSPSLIRVGQETSRSIFVSLRDEAGTLLSKRDEHVSTSDNILYCSIVLHPRSEHVWRLPVSSIVSQSDALTTNIHSRLSITGYFKVVDGAWTDSGEGTEAFLTGRFKLFDRDVLIGPASVRDILKK